MLRIHGKLQPIFGSLPLKCALTSFTLFAFTGCVSTVNGNDPNVFVQALRLEPGEDVKSALTELAKQHNWRAASVVSAVGSLKTAHLRFANQEQYSKIVGPLEVVSLTGLVSIHGLHLHAAVSDSSGRTLGGHLGDDSTVFTTLELAVQIYPGIEFHRVHNSTTGFKELCVEMVKANNQTKKDLSPPRCN